MRPEVLLLRSVTQGPLPGLCDPCHARLTTTCDRSPNSVSQLRPTVEKRSSRWPIVRCLFLCRVACVCLVPWARTCFSAGQHRYVAHRHASHTASILAVLLCAVALPGIANSKGRPQTMRSALGTAEAILGLSTACPPLVLWGWELLFDLADQGVEGFARDRDELPFFGYRDGRCHGLHV